MIRTKIIATMGPACGDVDALYRLFEAGADVCRLNFSHGSLDAHLLQLRHIREAAARFDHPIAVLGDLCGPKIRLGQVADVDGTGGLPIAVGDQLVIQRADVVGNIVSGERRVSSIYKHLVDDVQIGDRLLIEDGLLRFVCTDKNYNELRCQTTVGGILKSRKGINLPNTVVNVPSITDYDWECVNWAIDNDLDYLALSFVRKAEDLHLLREHLRNRVSDIHLIAKIEKSEAIKALDGILDASDGLMVARGDLGVEMDVAEVPILQKELIRRCQAAAKPVIVATQMLQSMIEQASPTRAEVSDVANAIFDGTDAVMLSGETSVGKFPIGAVHTMAHVAETTEQYLIQAGVFREPALKLKNMHLSGAVANGVWQIVQDLKVKLVVIWSQTGATARIFSKNRFPVPIIALSSDHRALRRMALHFGVVSQEMSPPSELSTLVAQVDAMVQEHKYAEAGDRIVLVAGSSMGTPGTLNGVIIHTVGEQWSTNPTASDTPALLATR
ncbi:MAG TPA: pyruvate kinase [Tepidisphaeraceae bacterium]|nr:pyruvate kinase [Tepidisphaeraceae bacterium]